MTVSITIDGRKLRVEEGMNLLEAALQNGIYIPHLCHHPDLPDPTWAPAVSASSRWKDRRASIRPASCRRPTEW